jgi:hypothetical protein
LQIEGFEMYIVSRSKKLCLSHAIYFGGKGSQFEVNLGKKLSKNPSQSISWVQWYMPVIPAIEEEA